MNTQIRVRFAPSPTGPLHIGGVRTALYNYLFARKLGGKLILRIEDTDQTRFVEGAEKYIIDALTWSGITFDEGVHVGGPHAPYKQSERSHIYKEYVQILLDNGFAYYAFDTPDELDALRSDYQTRKQTFQYDASTRSGLKNSLSLPESVIKDLIDSSTPYVIRFKTPENELVVVNDIIRGRVEVNSNVLDDKVLFKSDGLPTYHLANVVDDHLMQISHVIRGEEWLPSAPLHVLLYQSFGWLDSMPAFAHLPLLLKPDGNGKLSKRDGDRLGFPVFPMQWHDPITGEVSSGYRESGYFPQAFINMLAFLGWNPGIEQEIFSLSELVELFSLERITKSGAKFDPEKTKWFNHKYLQTEPLENLAKAFSDELIKRNVTADEQKIITVVALVRERANFTHELWAQAAFFFEKPAQYDQTTITKRLKPETPALLDAFVEKLAEISDWNKEQINQAIHHFFESRNLSHGALMPLVRIALVGELKGPDMIEIIYLIGKDAFLYRMMQFNEELKKMTH